MTTAWLPALDPVPGHAAAAALAVVLLVAALDKLRDPERFAAAVAGYRLLPAAAVAGFSRVLPLAEAAAGLALLPLASRGAGAALALALLALVSGAVVVNLARGRRDIDCGCGGEALPIGWTLVARNAVLAALALAAAAPVQPRATVWLDIAAAVFAALFLLGLHVVAHTLLAHEPKLNRLRNTP